MYDLLNTINAPSDLAELDKKELVRLCSQIREFLVEKVTKNGGHLASNLGVVELSVALHLVFDMPKDKIVWDVGHQSYVHKILTGRKEGFENLRKFNGLSGFPKTCESEYDFFNTGHSSTSVSAAVGMARARDLKSENHDIVAVFGDGALTGGMIYEALNDLGHKKTPLVLVLNDNEMSISQNVGALSRYLRRLRQSPGYHRSKKRIERVLQAIPFIGNPVRNSIAKLKDAIKLSIIPSTFFDDLGIEYLGPVDGHDIGKIKEVLTLAKNMKTSVLVHIITKKGKGYAPAEKNPQNFHGVSPKPKVTAEQKQYCDYSQCAGKTLVNLAKSNNNFVAITAAMPQGVGLSEFSNLYPDRFFDVGIAEEHAVTFSAGLAISGITPVFAVYSSFLQRAYDQILHDVCLQNLHVVLLVDRAGVVGADGETHHGLYDISFLSDMPNMTILSPSSFEDLEAMLDYAINQHTGPIAIRYPRGCISHTSDEGFVFGKVEVINPEGENLIITTGRMVENAKAAAKISENEVKIVNLKTLIPVCDTLLNDIKSAKKVIVLEDHSKECGLGEIISKLIATNGVTADFEILGYPNEPIRHGSVAELDKFYGLDAESIANRLNF